MIETPQQTYLLAATVVCLGLAVIGFFIREAISTSNFYQQGLTLYWNREYEGAEVAFRQVLSRHPSNDMVHLLLGDVLIQQDKLDEATVEFTELIGRAPKNVDAYLKLGTALVKQDKIEEAVIALEKARDLFKAQRNPTKADQVDQLLQQISAERSSTQKEV